MPILGPVVAMQLSTVSIDPSAADKITLYISPLIVRSHFWWHWWQENMHLEMSMWVRAWYDRLKIKKSGVHFPVQIMFRNANGTCHSMLPVLPKSIIRVGQVVCIYVCNMFVVFILSRWDWISVCINIRNESAEYGYRYQTSRPLHLFYPPSSLLLCLVQICCNNYIQL